MSTVSIHPLAEVIAKKLLGIESVPAKEQQKMVRRAVKAAVEWHETQMHRLNDGDLYEVGPSEVAPITIIYSQDASELIER